MTSCIRKTTGYYISFQNCHIWSDQYHSNCAQHHSVHLSNTRVKMIAPFKHISPCECSLGRTFLSLEIFSVPFLFVYITTKCIHFSNIHPQNLFISHFLEILSYVSSFSFSSFLISKIKMSLYIKCEMISKYTNWSIMKAGTVHILLFPRVRLFSGI